MSAPARSRARDQRGRARPTDAARRRSGRRAAGRGSRAAADRPDAGRHPPRRRPSPSGSSIVRRRRRRRRRRHRGSGPARRPGVAVGRAPAVGILAARCGLAPAQLLHEVVEQVAHRTGSLARSARLRAGAGPRPPGGTPPRTVSASSFGPHRRRPRRLEPERGPDRQRARATAGSGRRAGRPAPSRIWSRPASSRISPDSAPVTAGPSRASGGSGGGPAAGATSRKLTTPRRRRPTGSPATSRRGLGRPGHAGAERAVADADLVLAQERRTGRREAVGHGRRIARGPRPVGAGSRRRRQAGAGLVRRRRSAVGGAAVGGRRRRVGAARRDAAGDVASLRPASCRRRPSAAPSTRRADAVGARRPPLDGGLGAGSRRPRPGGRRPRPRARGAGSRAGPRGRAARAPAAPPASAVSSTYSPLIHDSRRFRCGRGSRLVAEDRLGVDRGHAGQ